METKNHKKDRPHNNKERAFGRTKQTQRESDIRASISRARVVVVVYIFLEEKALDK